MNLLRWAWLDVNGRSGGFVARVPIRETRFAPGYHVIDPVGTPPSRAMLSRGCFRRRVRLDSVYSASPLILIRSCAISSTYTQYLVSF